VRLLRTHRESLPGRNTSKCGVAAALQKEVRSSHLVGLEVVVVLHPREARLRGLAVGRGLHDDLAGPGDLERGRVHVWGGTRADRWGKGRRGWGEPGAVGSAKVGRRAGMHACGSNAVRGRPPPRRPRTPSPVHATPLPLKPSLQVQVWPPMEFVQSAWGEQGAGLAAHSSMSDRGRCGGGGGGEAEGVSAARRWVRKRRPPQRLEGEAAAPARAPRTVALPAVAGARVVEARPALAAVARVGVGAVGVGGAVMGAGGALVHEQGCDGGWVFAQARRSKNGRRRRCVPRAALSTAPPAAHCM
jgi:hypothetical protein